MYLMKELQLPYIGCIFEIISELFKLVVSFEPMAAQTFKYFIAFLNNTSEKILVQFSNIISNPLLSRSFLEVVAPIEYYHSITFISNVINNTLISCKSKPPNAFHSSPFNCVESFISSETFFVFIWLQILLNWHGF